MRTGKIKEIQERLLDAFCVNSTLEDSLPSYIFSEWIMFDNEHRTLRTTVTLHGIEHKCLVDMERLYEKLLNASGPDLSFTVPSHYALTW